MAGNLFCDSNRTSMMKIFIVVLCLMLCNVSLTNTFSLNNCVSDRYIQLSLDKSAVPFLERAANSTISSRKHAYIILTPLNPIFIQ